MLTLAQARPDTARAAPPAGCGRRTLSFRSVRPSLLDLRFTGDPTMVDHRDGTASLCLDDYRLVRIDLLPLDVPSFYFAVVRMRQSQVRRVFLRRRARELAGVGAAG